VSIAFWSKFCPVDFNRDSAACLIFLPCTHGLGSIFGGLFKAALPLLKKGAKTLGREALKTGLSTAGDVVQGRNIKQRARVVPYIYFHGLKSSW
jgi:hypothetical protein